MKKSNILLLMLSLTSLFTSCGPGSRHTTIVEKDNSHYMKIEFAGQVRFNNEGTSIASISRNGYVKYRYNDLNLEAENNGHGGIQYKLYDGDHRLSPENDGKKLIADAVRTIIEKTEHNPNWR